MTEIVVVLEEQIPEIEVSVSDIALKGDTGEKGDDGDKGDTGDSISLTIGEVTEVAPGDEFATITGTAPNLFLNLGLPLGVTEADFTNALNSLTTLVNTKATPSDIATAIVALSLGTASQHDASYFARPSDVTNAVASEATARNTAINSAITTLIGTAPSILDTLGELAAQLQADETGTAAILATIAGIQTALSSKAPSASPALTGTPTAPTPSVSDDSTKLATTSFVKAVIAALSTVYVARLSGTASQRAVSSQIGSPGDLWVDSDSGNFGFADGVNPLSGMPGIPILSKSGLAWWNKVITLAPTADQPSITLATSSQLSGSNVISPSTDLVFDPFFRYDNVFSLSVPSTPGYVKSAIVPGVIWPEFTTDDTNSDFEILLRSYNTAFTIRVEIDGRPHQLNAQAFTTTDATLYWVRVSFPTARARRIKLFLNGFDWFGGVKLPTAQTIVRPAQDVKRRGCFIGDSYLEGGPGFYPDNGNRLETFGYFLSKLLDLDSYFNMGISGTGWANSQGGTLPRFADQVPNVLSVKPHLVLFVGSRNDTAAGVDQTQVYTNALSALTMLSDTPLVYVMGPERSGSGYDTIVAGMKAACQKARRLFFDIRGTETAIMGGHPTFANQLTIAQAIYALLDRPHIDATMASVSAGRVNVTTTLSASPASTTYASNTVTLTATLTAPQSGKIQFYIDGVLVQTQNIVAASTASIATSTMAVGPHTLLARFVPQDPLNVRSSTSNPITYTINNNLGFVDSFSVAGQPVNTENSKPWETTYITNFVNSSGKLTAPSASSAAYLNCDAGVSDGVYTLVMGGTFNVNLGITIRYSSGNNNVFLNWNGGSNNPKLWVKTTASGTQAIATGTGGAWVSGDVIVITISGNSITVTKNGVTILTVSDITLGTNAGALSTNTKFGVQFSSTTTACSIDSVSFVAA